MTPKIYFSLLKLLGKYMKKPMGGRYRKTWVEGLARELELMRRKKWSLQ